MEATELLLLALLAGAMAYATAVLITWAHEARTPVAASAVVFLLAMMVAMLVGAGWYLRAPSSASAVVGLWVAAGLMSVAVFPVFLTFLREARARLEAGAAYRPSPLLRRGAFAAVVVALVLANELLMGWTFSVAAGASSPAGPIAALAAAVDSPWFLFTMSAEMALTALLLWDRLPGPARVILLAQAVLMFLSPPALADPSWRVVAIGLGSAGMTGLIVYVMEFLYRHRQFDLGLATYLVRLLAVYALMMAGLYLWFAEGSALLFALAVVLEMVLYLEAVLAPDRFRGGTDLHWPLERGWTFRALATIFLAELFMGALLDLAFLPAAYGSAFPSLALAGPASTVLYNAVYNGFWFVAAVTGSTWFLAMMGAEMGVLVLFRFREVRSTETRVRLALVLGSYAAFATFFPSYYYSALFPHAAAGTAVPVLGWSMGVGSAPIGPSIFLVLFLSYAVTGALAFLFGRRVICGVFCTAALMYGGTTFNAMSSFNRSAPIARKYLSSRFSGLYRASTGLAMGSLVVVSSLSYLDQVGKLSVTILGADPSVFFFSLSFGVLWYVIFVTIPYTGNYNCVTMGWCYTGTIAQAFQRLGFFRLKVRDRGVCQRCTTLDCAKSCPVGLVDMPGHFRQTGSFRSSKCCGVGNCVEACPYGNLYVWDVRHALGLRAAPPRVPGEAQRLPMAGSRIGRSGVPSASGSPAASGATASR